MEIIITPGDIEVEGVSAKVTEHAVLAYINTREKYVEAQAPEDNVVMLYADERTLRAGERIEDYAKEETTMVEFPEGWIVSVERGRYSARVIGIRSVGLPELDHDIPMHIQEK